MNAPWPYVPPPRPTWRSRLRGVVTERLGLKLTALLLSVLLWGVVSAREPTEEVVGVRVMPVLDSTLVLRDGPPELRALVAGRAADLVKLYASPLMVRRTIGGDVPDTLVLDVTPADVHVPAELSNEVRVLDVQPRSVTLRFEERATKHIPILNEGRVVVRTDSGIALADSIRFDPAEVRVTGPRRLVRALHGIRPFSLAIAERDTMAHVADLDTTGTGVRVEPMHVKVQIRRVAPLPPAGGDSARADSARADSARR